MLAFILLDGAQAGRLRGPLARARPSGRDTRVTNGQPLQKHTVTRPDLGGIRESRMFGQAWGEYPCLSRAMAELSGSGAENISIVTRG